MLLPVSVRGFRLIVVEARKIIRASKVVVIHDVTVAQVRDVQPELHEMLGVRPARHGADLHVAFDPQQIRLRSARGELILDHDLLCGIHAGRRMVLPAHLDLKLEQQVGRDCIPVVEHPLPFPLIGICRCFRQHEAAHALVEARVIPFGILPVGNVVLVELVADVKREQGVPLRAGHVFLNQA